MLNDVYSRVLLSFPLFQSYYTISTWFDFNDFSPEYLQSDFIQFNKNLL